MNEAYDLVIIGGGSAGLPSTTVIINEKLKPEVILVRKSLPQQQE